MAKRFTFADAKEKIKDLEGQLVDLTDNVVSSKELTQLRKDQKELVKLRKESKDFGKKVQDLTLELQMSEAKADSLADDIKSYNTVAIIVSLGFLAAASYLLFA